MAGTDPEPDAEPGETPACAGLGVLGLDVFGCPLVIYVQFKNKPSLSLAG